MKIGQLKQSKYLKKEDVGQGVVLTITRMEQQDVSMESEAEDKKPVLFFQESVMNEHKGLVMNWTNLQLWAIATGTEETDEWICKKIELYTDPNVSYQGKLIGGIRIRPAAERKAEAKSGTDSMKAAIESENPAEGME